MRGTAFRTIALAAIAVLLLAAAACGSGDDESAADTQAAAASTTDDGAATTAAADTTSDDGSDDTPSFEGSKDCVELAQLGAKVSEALGGTGADTEKTKEFLDEFADKAPDEISDDFQVIADAYSKIADAIADANVKPGETPDPEALAKLQSVATELDQTKLAEANTNITAWVSENCGALTTTTD
jgi:hypothetical protein